MLPEHLLAVRPEEISTTTLITSSLEPAEVCRRYRLS